MSKPLIVVVLLIAALASAALVFFAMSAFSEDEPPPVVANEPTTSAPAPEPEPAPTDAELVVRTDITDANLFVDAFDRGPIEAESWRTLPLGPHRIEARRGPTVIAALTVELGPNGADVELHADGTTAQAARAAPPVRVASARTREADRPAGQPSAPANEPTPTAPAPTAPAPAPSAPTAAPNEPDPAPSAPTTVATAPRVEPPPGVEPAPAAPIFGARPTAGVQVVDQNQAHTVAPPPVAPTVAPRVAAPVAPAAPPNEAQMRRALDSVMPAVRTCAGDFHGELDVTVSFSPDGTTRARIGRLPTREARYCVQGAIHERVRVPAFAGRATQIRHVYRL